MLTPPRRPRPSFDKVHFDELLTQGVAAVKGKQLDQARRFLEAAKRLDPNDPRVWVWLAATTSDRAEQRACLEEALALDPYNMTARRGLVALSEQGSHEPSVGRATPPDQPVPATARSFTCATCGGLVRYDLRQKAATCLHCGTVTEIEQRRATSHAHSLDLTLPTAQAQRGATAQHTLSCTSCGALAVLPPERLTTECAFCGSHQLLSSSQTQELIEPESILLAQGDEGMVRGQVRKWMGDGLLTPGNLARTAQAVTLRLAYYPVWSFDAMLFTRWSAQVRQQHYQGRESWTARKGEETFFFEKMLVPGLQALPLDELRAIQPFFLTHLVEFKQEFVAGWPAFLYDHSLAAATIVARGEMVRHAVEGVEENVLAGYEVKDLQVIPGGYSDQSYSQLLVPIWVGNYDYNGQRYRVLVNGQTGKVGGKKPRAGWKVTLAAVGTLLVLAALAALLLLFMRAAP